MAEWSNEEKRKPKFLSPLLLLVRNDDQGTLVQTRDGEAGVPVSIEKLWLSRVANTRLAIKVVSEPRIIKMGDS